jgi:predicted dehydrogenase
MSRITRRELLAALAVPAVAAERKLQVGIAGGGFGSAFYFHEHPNSAVAAVADLRADRREYLRNTYRCDTVYNSLAEMLKDKRVEAVGVFTPAPNHVSHVRECLAAGKHVLCAVPAAMSLEECRELIEAVRRSGLTYMMAETSYFQQPTISARKFYREGAFGRLYACESEYHHPGLEILFVDRGQRTGRYGFPPMHYPTHCTAHLVSVTGERLMEVTCLGWGDEDPVLKDNVYENPFWNETAFFKTNRGTSFRVEVWWKGAHVGTERAQYSGDRMSFYFEHPNGLGPVIVRRSAAQGKDSAGFALEEPVVEKYDQPRWWATDMLPAPLRHDSGHLGSQTFLTHEFVTAVLEGRRPVVDVYEAVAYTAPGIVAHQSALRGGEQLKVPRFDPA